MEPVTVILKHGNLAASSQWYAINLSIPDTKMEADGSMRKQKWILESHKGGVEWRDALEITSLFLDDNIKPTCFYSEVINYKSSQLRGSRQRVPVSMVCTLMAI
jgi:hypothetical protein